MDSRTALRILQEKPNHPKKSKLLNIIKKDSFCAYWYAREVMKGRWIEAEEIIKKNVSYAINYARGSW
jgi:hypothetical protein